MPDPSATWLRSRPSCASAAAAGSLTLPDTRLAAEQFVGLVRGEIQLRHLLRLEAAAGAAEPSIEAIVEGAVETFIRAFGCRALGPRRAASRG